MNVFDYIHIEEIESKGITKKFDVRNNKSHALLGMVKWYSPWRQYCFFPEEQTIFSRGCMIDILNFINQLMAEKATNEAEKVKKFFNLV